MSAAIFARRLGKLEQIASRYAARAWGELLALMTDEELEEVRAMLTRNNASYLPAPEAARYVEIITKAHGRRPYVLAPASFDAR